MEGVGEGVVCTHSFGVEGVRDGEFGDTDEGKGERGRGWSEGGEMRRTGKGERLDGIGVSSV